MNEFLFDLKSAFIYRNDEFIVVGKAKYLGDIQNRYLLQKLNDWKIFGLDFTRGRWVEETDLVKAIPFDYEEEN